MMRVSTKTLGNLLVASLLLRGSVSLAIPYEEADQSQILYSVVETFKRGMIASLGSLEFLSGCDRRESDKESRLESGESFTVTRHTCLLSDAQGEPAQVIYDVPVSEQANAPGWLLNVFMYAGSSCVNRITALNEMGRRPDEVGIVFDSTDQTLSWTTHFEQFRDRLVMTVEAGGSRCVKNVGFSRRSN